MIGVKICGLNDKESREAALKHGADFLGFVFCDKSPRHLSMEEAAALFGTREGWGKAKLVAVCQDASLETLRALAEKTRPDMLQFHGRESPAFVGEARRVLGKPVIKALHVREAADLEGARTFTQAAMLLFEPPPPAPPPSPVPLSAPDKSARRGGHGRVMDWSLFHGRTLPKPWILSGGLTAENLPRAVKASGALYADVSSGVERAPGVKDRQKIADFLRAAKTL